MYPQVKLGCFEPLFLHAFTALTTYPVHAGEGRGTPGGFLGGWGHRYCGATPSGRGRHIGAVQLLVETKQNEDNDRVI